VIYRFQTAWRANSASGSAARGRSLVLKATGEEIGSVEPYRGSRKAWWLTVSGLPPFLNSPYGPIRIYLQFCLSEVVAQRRICDLYEKRAELLQDAQRRACF